MIRLPTMVRPVRVICGQAGPMLGPTGPSGTPTDPPIGATGPLGAIGRLGMTGPVGLPGMLATLLGPTGIVGPNGSQGYRGMTGPTGSGLLCPDLDYIRVFEKSDGYGPFTPAGRYIGCGFRYTGKSEKGYIFILFTGQFTSTADMYPIKIGIQLGVDTAPPNAGTGSGGVTNGIGGNAGNGWVGLKAPADYKIPFFILAMRWNASSAIPGFPTSLQRNFWFDLAASVGTSGFDPPAHFIDRIQCCVFEVPVI
jgi:hypothetical protein